MHLNRSTRFFDILSCLWPRQSVANLVRVSFWYVLALMLASSGARANQCIGVLSSENRLTRFQIDRMLALESKNEEDSLTNTEKIEWANLKIRYYSEIGNRGLQRGHDGIFPTFTFQPSYWYFENHELVSALLNEGIRIGFNPNVSNDEVRIDWDNKIIWMSSDQKSLGVISQLYDPRLSQVARANARSVRALSQAVTNLGIRTAVITDATLGLGIRVIPEGDQPINQTAGLLHQDLGVTLVHYPTGTLSSEISFNQRQALISSRTLRAGRLSGAELENINGVASNFIRSIREGNITRLTTPEEQNLRYLNNQWNRNFLTDDQIATKERLQIQQWRNEWRPLEIVREGGVNIVHLHTYDWYFNDHSVSESIRATGFQVAYRADIPGNQIKIEWQRKLLFVGGAAIENRDTFKSIFSNVHGRNRIDEFRDIADRMGTGQALPRYSSPADIMHFLSLSANAQRLGIETTMRSERVKYEGKWIAQIGIQISPYGEHRFNKISASLKRNYDSVLTYFQSTGYEAFYRPDLRLISIDREAMQTGRVTSSFIHEVRHMANDVIDRTAPGKIENPTVKDRRLFLERSPFPWSNFTLRSVKAGFELLKGSYRNFFSADEALTFLNQVTLAASLKFRQRVLKRASNISNKAQMQVFATEKQDLETRIEQFRQDIDHLKRRIQNSNFFERYLSNSRQRFTLELHALTNEKILLEAELSQVQDDLQRVTNAFNETRNVPDIFIPSELNSYLVMNRNILWRSSNAIQHLLNNPREISIEQDVATIKNTYFELRLQLPLRAVEHTAADVEAFLRRIQYKTQRGMEVADQALAYYDAFRNSRTGGDPQQLLDMIQRLRELQRVLKDSRSLSELETSE